MENFGFFSVAELRLHKVHTKMFLSLVSKVSTTDSTDTQQTDLYQKRSNIQLKCIRVKKHFFFLKLVEAELSAGYSQKSVEWWSIEIPIHNPHTPA